MTAFTTPPGIRIPPTQSARRVLRGLAEVLNREGTASIREIGEAAGFSSPSGVLYHLRKLVLAGYVEEPVPGRPRGWRLTVDGWKAASVS